MSWHFSKNFIHLILPFLNKEGYCIITVIVENYFFSHLQIKRGVINLTARRNCIFFVWFEGVIHDLPANPRSMKFTLPKKSPIPLPHVPFLSQWLLSLYLVETSFLSSRLREQLPTWSLSMDIFLRLGLKCVPRKQSKCFSETRLFQVLD